MSRGGTYSQTLVLPMAAERKAGSQTVEMDTPELKRLEDYLQITFGKRQGKGLNNLKQ